MLDFNSAFTHSPWSSYRTSFAPLVPSPNFHRRNQPLLPEHHCCRNHHSCCGIIADSSPLTPLSSRTSHRSPLCRTTIAPDKSSKTSMSDHRRTVVDTVYLCAGQPLPQTSLMLGLYCAGPRTEPLLQTTRAGIALAPGNHCPSPPLMLGYYQLWATITNNRVSLNRQC